MFNLFAVRARSNFRIVKNADALMAAMEREVSVRQAALDALGDCHGDVDLELVRHVAFVIDPRLGPQGIEETSAWFHSMDFYGDGIRHLEFKPGRFPIDAIPELQALLVGEFISFGILCWAPIADGGNDGCVVFHDKVLITRGLAAAIAQAAS